MTEVKTPPVEGHGETVSFTPDHSLADIARWIMCNRSEAEDLHVILGQMLSGTYGETMQ